MNSLHSGNPCGRLHWAALVAAAVFVHSGMGDVVVSLDFEDGAGQLAQDTTSAENHGILGGKTTRQSLDPTWTATGHAGGALSFDGKDDVLVIPCNPSFSFTKGIVVEAWVRQRRRTPFARVIDQPGCFDLYIHTDGIASFRFRGAEAHGVRSPQPIPLGTWVQLRGAYDGAVLSLAVNGKTVARRAYTESIPNLATDLRIGAALHGRHFCGVIDQVRVVNPGYRHPDHKALTVDEDTVGLWRFDALGSPKDSGPNRLNGSAVHVSMAAGYVGGAYRFDGKGVVRIAHAPVLDLQEELCIECRIRQEKRSAYARILEKDDWTYALWVTPDGTLDFAYTSSRGEYCHTMAREVIPLNKWTRIRVDFDSFEKAIFVNGVQVLLDEVPDKDRLLAKSDGDLFIGNRRAGDRGFIGQIDEVRLSRRVRRVLPLIRVRIRPFPSTGTARVTVGCPRLRDKIASLDGVLLPPRLPGKPVRNGRDAASVASFSIRSFSHGIGDAEFSLDNVTHGEFRLVLTARSRDGEVVGRETLPFHVPATPWRGSRCGTEPGLLPPWTPMRVQPSNRGTPSVQCWGREYILGRKDLLNEIHSQGRNLLSGPVRMLCSTAAVGRVEAAETRLVIARVQDHKVTATGVIEGPTAKGRIEFLAEYDGMVRFDMDVASLVPGSSLCIDIPLSAESAPLMHHPGKWFQDSTCAGSIPTGGWRNKTAWYLWLGNPDRGICWFAEDQETWPLSDARPGIEVSREGHTVRLRVWLVHAESTKRFSPRRFTWGLMATPVKPLPEGWRQWRFGTLGRPVTIGVLWSTLRTSRWHSFPVPPDPGWYRDQVRAAHAEHKRFVPYTNFNMQSDTGREWPYWGEEWKAYAGFGKAADVLAMNVVNVRCCAMTPSWCDFITWKYKVFLERYNSDGFYLDNSIPSRCANPHHPAEHKHRRHIFAARNLMRRFYAITKRDSADNVMVCHMSSCAILPVLSFCDAIVDGEQYGYLLKDEFDGHYMDNTPLDRMRAELMGWHWGLVPFFLPCNRGPNPWTPDLTRELMGLVLSHGARFWLGGNLSTMTKALDVLDRFGIDKAEFVPYWSIPAWESLAARKGIAVSAYLRSGRTLLIVANTAHADTQVSVPLTRRIVSHISRETRVQDLLDKSTVSIEGGELLLAVRGRNLRIVGLDITRSK